MIIRKMTQEDLLAASEVHKAAFPRQDDSLDWLTCNFNCYPRMQLFVAEAESGITGYIHWTQRSGFRPEVVLELEQLAVHPKWQGKGVGTGLIQKSLPLVKSQLAERGAVVKHLVVTTRADNDAQKLYRKLLGAEIEATICDLYSADEVFMIARHVD